MAGPLVNVKTITAGVRLDVSRLLNTGQQPLVFVVPDATLDPPWREVKRLVKNFDRDSQAEVARGDGRTVVFQVADLDGDMNEVIREADLHVLWEGTYYKVGDVPSPASNEGQVFVITATTRTARKTYFDNKR
jgi:hypothetical protein